MLTTDLVRARRKAGELIVNPLAEDQRGRVLALAEVYVATVRGFIGKTRDELDEALGQLEPGPRDRLVAEGLRKLIEDRCEFDTPEGIEPEVLRREVFLLASAARRGVPVTRGAEDQGDLFAAKPPEFAKGTFDRAEVLAAVAAQRQLTVEALESGLYADLRGAQLLKEVAPLSARELVEGYDTAQAQAVLLRAVRVVADVHCGSAGAYRLLFRKLKFLRLLLRIETLPSGYKLEIDGPYSLFDQVTKYGLQLALALPAIVACDGYKLRADVRWGKERAPLVFKLEGGGAARGPESEAELVPDEVAALVRGFTGLGSPFDVVLAPAVLHLPGVGVCVPDLMFRHRDSGLQIYFEVMGYWSRDAVWRRVELVEAGLREPILFALSERLRVSEQALPADLPAALYVYKGVISPRVVLERLERIAVAAARKK